jgi:hypothetical protein
MKQETERERFTNSELAEQLLDPDYATASDVWALRQEAAARLRQSEQEPVLEAVRRMWPIFEKSTKGLVFTAERAGEVGADMQTLSDWYAAPQPAQPVSLEQQLRDVLQKMGSKKVQDWTAGDLMQIVCFVDSQ